MVERLAINQEVLAKYVQASNTPLDYLKQKLPKIEAYLTGQEKPTFNQLSTIAKLINIPTGLLLLNQFIASPEIEADFRTIDFKTINEMSKELRETIVDMQDKQAFLREEIIGELPFIGQFTLEDSDEKILNTIRHYLGENITSGRFSTYRNELNQLGVFVFINGIVKENTHRNLNLEEFRGFVLSDNKAPIIFINQKDSNTGRLFTLIHEFVHLFFGQDHLLDLTEFPLNPLEVKVNRITAEILVPKDIFLSKYNEQLGIDVNLNNLAKYFEVSKQVVVRRMYDLKFISKVKYQEIVKQLKEEFQSMQSPKNKITGNYRNTLKYRVDPNFYQYVSNAVKEQRLSYTEAFRLIGVGYKGYQVLGERNK